MIYNDNFVWLHLPKTGGTTVHNLFKDMDIPGLHVDDNNSKTKHDSLQLREKTGWRTDKRKPFITFRNLENWLISDWLHKKTWMGLTELPFEPVRSGLFYSLRLGGTWVAADWWIQYFQIDDSFTFLRLEHLEEDINNKLMHYITDKGKNLKIKKHDNQNKYRSRIAKSCQIDQINLDLIKTTNPKWASIEASLYN